MMTVQNIILKFIIAFIFLSYILVIYISYIYSSYKYINKYFRYLYYTAFTISNVLFRKFTIF